jgi:hypothetical protein
MSVTAAPVYGMSRPSVAATRAALSAVSSHSEAITWDRLLASAGLTGAETDVASLERLLVTMTAAGGVTAQCARAQSIRLVCHTRLTAVQDLVQPAA